MKCRKAPHHNQQAKHLGQSYATYAKGIRTYKPQVNLSALIFAVVEHTIDPIVKGKGGGAGGQTVVPSPGRALRCVVKLHKQEIKRRVLNGIVKMSIWDNALGRSRDIVGS